MPVGTLPPEPYLTIFDNNGIIVPGALLYTYASGTSTPQAIYADSLLTVPLANPFPADSAGRLLFYLAPLAYSFVIKTPAGVTLISIDPVQSTSVVAAQATNNGVCEGRLTLTSGTPVTTADVLASPTVYFTPYKGNRIALWDGNAWNIRTITESAIGITSTASKLFDIFAADQGGVPVYSILAWTNDTTRAQPLVALDGVLMLATTNSRYLGTVRTTAASTVEDSAVKRYVWNMQNRVRRPLLRKEATATWTYSLNTWRQANAAAANQLDVVVGWPEVTVHVICTTQANNSGATGDAHIAIGEDSTTTPAAESVGGSGNAPVTATFTAPLVATLAKMPAVGRHTYVWLEKANAGATGGVYTWFGVVQVSNGLSGSIEC